MKSYINDIEQATLHNENFRQVLYTGKHSQLVVMSIEAGSEIGEETHNSVDQFLRIEAGQGKVVLDGVEHELADGFAIVVPAGAKHNIINTGKEALKLYTVYSPPNHKDGLVHKTKADADQDEPNDHWDGSTTE
ncbi:MAG TPA: cupin domain-containing protein [Candidatus Paceibacterota bacterium]